MNQSQQSPLKFDENLNKSFTNSTASPPTATPPATLTTNLTTSNYLSKRYSENPISVANPRNLPIRTHSIASSSIFTNGPEFTNLNDRLVTATHGDHSNSNNNLLDISHQTQSSSANHNDSINIDIDDDLVKACIITNLNAAAAIAVGSHSGGFAHSIISSFSGANTCIGDDGSMSSEVKHFSVFENDPNFN
jgi:hypothetical protein